MRRTSLISLFVAGALFAGVAPLARAQGDCQAMHGDAQGASAKHDHASTAAPVPVVEATEAAPQTLLSGKLTHGGFGGPVMSYSTVGGEPALFFGGRGGWLINHRLVIGGAAHGVTNRVAVPAGATLADADHQLMFGYGGFWMEYIVAPSRLVHGSLGALVGAGGLRYHRFRYPAFASEMEDDPVFVLDPTVSVELNVVQFMRLALFANYRFVAGVNLAGLDDGAVSGFGAGAMLKFGSF